jgi:Zn-dependent peptidase ImmA (M78 family)
MGKIVKFSRHTYREGVNMCKVLKDIQGKTADMILKEYGQDDSIPVNLNQLLLNIGISALPLDFTDLEKEIDCPQGDILGLVLSKGEKAAIFYKKDDTLNRQRFTIAHELAHCCLHTVEYDKPHVEFRMNDSQKDQHEKEADIFAGQLLVPLKRLQEVYLKLAVPSSITLASKFAVSVNVMEARLDYLKISYFNKDGQAIAYEN